MPALAAVDRALAQTSELSGTVAGCCASVSFSPPRVRRLRHGSSRTFQARYPACEVRLQEVETFDAYRALRRGDIDVLCNWLAVDEPDLVAGSHVRPLPAGARRSRLRTASQGKHAVLDRGPGRRGGRPAPAVHSRRPSRPAIPRARRQDARSAAPSPPRRSTRFSSLVARGRIVHPTSSTIPISTASMALDPSTAAPAPARPGLVREPGEPAHPRPERVARSMAAPHPA